MSTWAKWNERYCAWSHERRSYHNTDDELEHIYHVILFIIRAELIVIERKLHNEVHNEQ